MQVILKRGFFDGVSLHKSKGSQPVEVPDCLFGKLPDDAVVVVPPKDTAKAKTEGEKVDRRKKDGKENLPANGETDFTKM
jgi:hypothetical protein